MQAMQDLSNLSRCQNTLSLLFAVIKIIFDHKKKQSLHFSQPHILHLSYLMIDIIDTITMNLQQFALRLYKMFPEIFV